MTRASAQKTSSTASDQPYIPAHVTLPEITFKALALGIFLAILLAASNAYLGLKIGQTVSACIPAAVISMAVLRAFKSSNILENNMVQTIASAGEVIAAGVIFTLPALVLMNFWQGFPYIQTTAIAAIGGVIGVLFSVPLRRALIVDAKLKFPEGVATAEVLKAGEASRQASSKTESTAKILLVGGVLAAGIKFFQSGLQVISESLVKWFSVGGTIFGFGTGLSPVMIAAGYIVGFRVALSLILGTVFTWLIVLPTIGYVQGLPDAGSLQDIAMTIWSKKMRYIGVGGMIVGGIWTLISLIKPIKEGIRSSIHAVRDAADKGVAVVRTEKDISMTWVAGGTVAMAIPVFILFTHFMSVNNMPITDTLFWITIAFTTLFSLVCGFVCASIAGYMTGIVGSSSNPLSGVTISAILGVSLVLLALLGTQIDFALHPDEALSAAAIAVVIGGVVACAAAISGDNLQDLKTGHMVGATPWKQEAMLMVGALAGAMVMAPVLNLLYEAYGIGGSFPREGMDVAQSLAAPQAALMSSVAKGMFLGGLPWDFIIIGMILAVGLVIVNTTLKNTGSSWNFPVLAVSLGLYLPFDVTVTFFIGALLKLAAEKALATQRAKKTMTAQQAELADRRGMLFASGAIAGEALMGIFLAIPFALYQSTSVFSMSAHFNSALMTAGTILVIGGFLGYFYKVASRP